MSKRLAVAVSLTLIPRLVSANAAAPPRPDAMSSLGSVGDAKTPLAVRSASLTIDCKASDGCALEVHYAIENPTDAPLTGTAAFYGISTTEVHVTVDGRPANVGLTASDGASYDTAVEHEMAERGLGDRGGVGRQGFTIEVAAHATAAVIVTGTITPIVFRGYDAFVLPADRARHLVLTPTPPARERVRLEYLVAPIRTWGAFPAEMTFRLVHPRGWTAYVDGAADPQSSGHFSQRVGADGRTVREERISTSINNLSLDIDLGDHGQRLRGGIFAAIGGQVDDATGVRTRVGAELAWRRHYLTSLALEIESGSPTSYIVVPAVHAAAPWMLLFPSFGVGLGLPIRVSPDTNVGIRFQLDAHLGPLGYFVAFDTYPRMTSGPRQTEVVMMAQLSI